MRIILKNIFNITMLGLFLGSCSTKNTPQNQKPEDDCKSVSALSGEPALNDIVKMSEVVAIGSCRLMQISNPQNAETKLWLVAKGDSRLVSFEINSNEAANISAKTSTCSGVPYWNTTTKIVAKDLQNPATLFWNVREDTLQTKEFVIRDTTSNSAVLDLSMCQ